MRATAVPHGTLGVEILARPLTSQGTRASLCLGVLAGGRAGRWAPPEERGSGGGPPEKCWARPAARSAPGCACWHSSGDVSGVQRGIPDRLQVRGSVGWRNELGVKADSPPLSSGPSPSPPPTLFLSSPFPIPPASPCRAKSMMLGSRASTSGFMSVLMLMKSTGARPPAGWDRGLGLRSGRACRGGVWAGAGESGARGAWG